MRRILLAVTAVCTAVVALLVAPSTASARAVVDLHKVDLRGLTIPGSTCFANHPITMHNGHGVGGKIGQSHLVADEYGKPVYGDVTHDGHAEAFVAVDCSTGAGTAASEVKFTWVAFTGAGGKAHVLGVLAARHQWLNAYPTVLQAPKIVKNIVYVHETIWFADDPDCCGTGNASVTWSYTDHALRVRTSKLAVTDRIVTNTAVGRAYVYEPTTALKKTYGAALHSAVYSPGCRAYWHGPDQAKSFGALVDFTRSARVFGIYAPTGSVTTAGVGTYSTLAQIKKAYAGHKVTVSGDHKSVYVKYPKTYLAFGMDTSQKQAFVRSIRIGQYEFVTGQHTCTS